MTTDIQVTPDGEVVRPAPLTLFGTDNPVEVVARATAVAMPLAEVITKRKLAKHIGQSDHVFVEGWTLLGSMLGVFAEIEWSRPITSADGSDGWEARAVARTLAGRPVGSAEAMCTRAEGKWKRSDEYAIRSMAQTRAVSKALRMPLGFIMELAGFSATPAEEIPTESAEPTTTESRRAPRAGARAASSPSAPPSYRREELANLLAEKSLDANVLTFYADLIGIPKGERATDEQIDKLIEAVKGHGTDAEIVLEDPAAPVDSDEGLPEIPAELASGA